MKTSLTSGLSQTVRWQIDASRTIDFMGEDGRVYATPDLVRDIEHTCRDFLLQHIDEGEDSVGTAIAIRHLAPTLLNMSVDITVTINALSGRSVTFTIEARDNLDLVCQGTHDRFIVGVEQTRSRLRAKAERMEAVP